MDYSKYFTLYFSVISTASIVSTFLCCTWQQDFWGCGFFKFRTYLCLVLVASLPLGYFLSYFLADFLWVYCQLQVSEITLSLNNSLSYLWCYRAYLSFETLLYALFFFLDQLVSLISWCQSLSTPLEGFCIQIAYCNVRLNETADKTINVNEISFLNLYYN